MSEVKNEQLSHFKKRPGPPHLELVPFVPCHLVSTKKKKKVNDTSEVHHTNRQTKKTRNPKTILPSPSMSDVHRARLSRSSCMINVESL